MNQYEKANIEVHSVQQLASGNTEIVYQPILESMHYCPGVSIQQETGRQKISFIRCGIKEKCDVDATSEKVEQGKFRVVIQSSVDNIDMVFSDGEIPLSK